MFDAHTDDTFGDGNGVLGDKLFKGDEEAGLYGDTAGDGCGASCWLVCEAQRHCMGGSLQSGRILCEKVSEQVEQETEDIRYHCDEQDELCEFR